MPDGWAAEFHIYPTADTVAHELGHECMCGPRHRLTTEDQDVWVHASADGREVREPDVPDCA